MKKRYLALAIVSTCFFLPVFAEKGQAQQASSSRRVLIGFKGNSGLEAAEKHRLWMQNLSQDIHHSFHLLPLVSARLPENVIAKLRTHPEIAYVEDDIIVRAVEQEIPWGVDRINADLMWNISTGKGIRVAMLDTGIDYDHPDLSDNVVAGVNFTGWFWTDGSTNKFYWNDKNGHGSHCAGIVAALNNEIGVVGVAPDADLIAVKVLDDFGEGYVSDIIQGLEWCVNNDINIISMSFGATEYSESLANACDAAYNAGLLLVAAGGNENGGAVIYPAACDSVIAVSAINASDEVADFSSTGAEIELAAPAVDIISTYKNGGYAIGSGTSMAGPHVAGAAALVWAAEPYLTNQQLRIRLQETAEDLGDPGPDKLFGYGLVNPSATIQPPEPFTDLAITVVSADDSVVRGDTININVVIENTGNQNVTSDVTVTLSDDTDGITIGAKTISDGLPAGASAILTYSWQTNDSASISDHVIIAGHNFSDDNVGNDLNGTTIIVEEKPEAPTAFVSIDMSKQVIWKWWKATATVTVTDDKGTGTHRATVEGHWSGAYGRNVQAITRYGQATFQTGWIQKSGTVTFTVDRIIINGQEYLLSNETSDSISH